jgi:hypothetical protein
MLHTIITGVRSSADSEVVLRISHAYVPKRDVFFPAAASTSCLVLLHQSPRSMFARSSYTCPCTAVKLRLLTDTKAPKGIILKACMSLSSTHVCDRRRTRFRRRLIEGAHRSSLDALQRCPRSGLHLPVCTNLKAGRTVVQSRGWRPLKKLPSWLPPLGTTRL